jgi:hypothetical protein
MKVTLDTSILLELWKDQDKRAVVERLLRVAEEKGLDLAITARVREDIPEEPPASKINTLSDIGVEESGSVTRLDHWELNRDQLGSDALTDFWLRLESDRKEGGDKLPDWRDQDHLHAHMLQGRTVFVTWDGPILELRQVLQERFGIRVQGPEEFLEEIDTDATEDRS